MNPLVGSIGESRQEERRRMEEDACRACRSISGAFALILLALIVPVIRDTVAWDTDPLGAGFVVLLGLMFALGFLDGALMLRERFLLWRFDQLARATKHRRAPHA